MKSSRDDDQDSMSDGDLDDTNEIIVKSDQKCQDITKEINDILNDGFNEGVSEQLKKCNNSCMDNVAFINLLVDSLGNNTNCIKRKKSSKRRKSFGSKMGVAVFKYHEVYPTVRKIQLVEPGYPIPGARHHRH